MSAAVLGYWLYMAISTDFSTSPYLFVFLTLFLSLLNTRENVDTNVSICTETLPSLKKTEQEGHNKKEFKNKQERKKERQTDRDRETEREIFAERERKKWKKKTKTNKVDIDSSLVENSFQGIQEQTIRIIIIIIIIIAFKGAIRDFLQSPHSAANCLQHVRSSGPGAIVCKSHATHRTLITCKCHVTCHLV